MIDPAAKFGLSPDPSVLNALAGNQRERAGARRMPHGVRGVTFASARAGRAADPVRTTGADGSRAPYAAGTRAPQANGSRVPQANGARMPRAVQTRMSEEAGTVSMTPGMADTAPGPQSAGNVSPAMNKDVQAGMKTGREAYLKRNRAKNSQAGFGLLSSQDDLLRGFIMAEVLGRPKCLRRGGGRI